MNLTEVIKIEDTALATVYLSELYSLAFFIKKKCQSLFNNTKSENDGNYYIFAKPEIINDISSILTDAANLKKLITSPYAQKKGEKEINFKFRKARAAFLMSLLNDVGINEILNVKIRNTLEHFEEYLDNANIDITFNDGKGFDVAICNIALSSRLAMQGNIYPLRFYIADEKIYHNFEWQVDIGLIHDEACNIIEKLSTHQYLARSKEPQSSIIRLK